MENRKNLFSRKRDLKESYVFMNGKKCATIAKRKTYFVEFICHEV